MARPRALETLAAVNVSLSRELDLERLLQQITAAVADLTDADNVVLWQAEVATRRVLPRAFSRRPAIGAVEMPPFLAFGQGGTGWVAEHRQPLFVDDVTADPRIIAVDWALANDLRGFAGVPLLAGDELLGVLMLNLRRGRLLDGDERALLSAFAAQAAVAMRNANLFGEVTRRGDRLRKVADLARSVSGALELEAVLSQVTAAVVDLRPGILCIVRLVDREAGGYRLAGMGGAAAGGRVTILPFGEGLTHVVAEARRSLLVADTRVDARTAGKSWFDAQRLTVFYGVPIEAGGDLLGVLIVNFPTGELPTADEREAIDLFAGQAAVAIRNASLFAESEGRRRAAQALADVGRTLARTLDPDVVAREVAESVRALFGAMSSVVYRVEPSGDLRALAFAGEGAPARAMPAVARGTMGIGLAARERRAVATPNILTDPRITLTDEQRALLTRLPHRSVLAVPLLRDDAVVGAMSIGDREARVFTPEEMRLAQAFADQAALALENARLHEQTQLRLRELRETQAQLVQAGKLSAIGQLVSGVAHELNNPLSVVTGYSQLLLRKEPPEPMRGQLEAIVAQADRMARIVQGLLLFARQRAPERLRLNLADVLSQTVALRATHLRLSGIAVEVESDADLPPVAGDVSQLQQVFLNLLLNAEQAMTEAGVGDRIEFRATTQVDATGRFVVGTVTDNGPGIPAEVLPRIFEPFFTTKTVGAGTGLGLSVSYGIVEHHGGRIDVTSEPGRTTFSVALPVSTAPPPAPAVAPVAGRRTPARTGHALVVDDEAPVADLIVTLLKDAGWTVDEAASGQAGLQRVRKGTPDLIVSDIRMPDGSGEAFYRAVVAERPELAARFLFITGDTANATALAFLEQTGVAALRKPFTAEDFFQAVDALPVLPH